MEYKLLKFDEVYDPLEIRWLCGITHVFDTTYPYEVADRYHYTNKMWFISICCRKRISVNVLGVFMKTSDNCLKWWGLNEFNEDGSSNVHLAIKNMRKIKTLHCIFCKTSIIHELQEICMNCFNNKIKLKERKKREKQTISNGIQENLKSASRWFKEVLGVGR